MSITRRNFLRNGTMIALSAALPLSLSTLAAGQKRQATKPNAERPSVPAAAQRDPLYNYTRETFSPYVNSIFIVNSIPLAEIVLTEVKETPLVRAPRSSRVPVGECFTLTFRGPARTRFTQNTYNVEHAALGKFNLFITPTDRPGGTEQLYTAVINRRQ